ncbi:MAG: hypothetical protein AAFN77_24470 [Planctomycetota bacterium]
MKIGELFPGIHGDAFYLSEMRSHGHPLDPNLSLSEIDNYNLNHFTYRNDCHFEVYAEITRRLRRDLLQTYNGLTGDMFNSLVTAPVQRLPETLRKQIVHLFYDVQQLQETIQKWKNHDGWRPYVEY